MKHFRAYKNGDRMKNAKSHWMKFSRNEKSQIHAKHFRMNDDAFTHTHTLRESNSISLYYILCDEQTQTVCHTMYVYAK